VTDISGSGPAPVDSIYVEVDVRDGAPLVLLASVTALDQHASVGECSLEQLDAWADAKWSSKVDLVPVRPYALERRRKLTLECMNRYWTAKRFAVRVTRLVGGEEETQFFEPGEIEGE
jgi:hypothetical protein